MELGKFLKQRDIIYTLCAASISAQIVIIADALTSSCIVPILNKTSYHINDTQKTEKKIENFVVDMGGAKIELGKIFISIMRLIIVIIILYTIYYLMY